MYIYATRTTRHAKSKMSLMLDRDRVARERSKQVAERVREKSRATSAHIVGKRNRHRRNTRVSVGTDTEGTLGCL
ncbi:hypothetical protein KIPB_016735 [Kipferlia bialata]|uniref:Uncharacterized protein n=1 Tax=Kipferlia bialata TaxID=797122 RepID=A0A9K3GSJ1_9EUKA|nr:hypothetical protein KIPB_016735 [Kipferlia bialata]|eukprot:g16735.t1